MARAVAGIVLLALLSANVHGELSADCAAHRAKAEGLSDIPKPTVNQINWQRQDMGMFLHFGVNTYTGREWGLGNEDPNIFQPLQLNTTQWVQVAKQAGFQEMILVTKHHDGFMLYPTSYTNHSVKGSSWRDGKGDVVGDFARSCAQLGMNAAFYLSPWDRNYFNMTWKPSYNQFYLNTMRVLVSNYGPATELWWDGANAQPGQTHFYNWTDWLQLLRSAQPGAVGGGCGGDDGTFDCGPDTAWIGNEGGMAPEHTVSYHDASVEFPTPDGSPVYAPYYCDVSIRPGWFWHPEENNQLKTLSQLVDIYFGSVGNNCMLQLNVPPNTDGLLEDGDVKRVLEFGNYIQTTFATDFALNASANASSVICGSSASFVCDGDTDTYWMPDVGVTAASVQLKLLQPSRANVVMIQEHIAGGQKVSGYTVDVQPVGSLGWQRVATGTAIGYKKLNRFATLEVSQVRLNILGTFDNLTFKIENLGLFYATPIAEPAYPSWSSSSSSSSSYDSSPGYDDFRVLEP